MGLDMYLYRETYVKNWDHLQKKWSVSVTVDGDELPSGKLDTGKIAYVKEEIAYWRKANQVHAWFVRNIQGGKDDCNEYEVSREDLGKLVRACREVIADHQKAEELLPVQPGFFFGSTDYDEYYFLDLEKTIEMMTPLIQEGSDDYGSFIYQSSW